jgi:hypothetical protein
MSARLAASAVESQQVDRTALLLMLSYIEAECRRIGATEAARHAALAAALVPGGGEGGQAAPVPSASLAPQGTRRGRGTRLH